MFRDGRIHTGRRGPERNDPAAGPLVSRARKILALLKRTYPDAECALHFKNPLQLLVATILAAQCTDERVNQVTPPLFKKYRTATDYAKADLKKLQQEVHSTGFFRQKAKSLQGVGRMLVETFGGTVPKTMQELVTLPGVGRKTSNVVLGNCFGVPGIVVDTHVRRLAFRMGLTRRTDPDKIEQDLMKLFPHSEWTKASHGITFHGRQVCKAIKPACSACPIESLCPKMGILAQ